MWGNGENGQLTYKKIKGCSHPIPVELPSLNKVIDAQCGDSHIIALSNNGEVFIIRHMLGEQVI